MAAGSGGLLAAEVHFGNVPGGSPTGEIRGGEFRFRTRERRGEGMKTRVSRESGFWNTGRWVGGISGFMMIERDLRSGKVMGLMMGILRMKGLDVMDMVVVLVVVVVGFIGGGEGVVRWRSR